MEAKESILDENFYVNVRVFGNLIFDRIQKEAENESDQFPPKNAKEDFAETMLETYCWVIVKELKSEEELLAEQIDFEDEELFVRLMKDIPGEAG